VRGSKRVIASSHRRPQPANANVKSASNESEPLFSLQKMQYLENLPPAPLRITRERRAHASSVKSSVDRACVCNTDYGLSRRRRRGRLAAARVVRAPTPGDTAQPPTEAAAGRHRCRRMRWEVAAEASAAASGGIPCRLLILSRRRRLDKRRRAIAERGSRRRGRGATRG
jgi:hypothetical protein